MNGVTTNCPDTSQLRIELDDVSRPDVVGLLQEHLAHMQTLSPPESVHALPVDKLRHPDVTFWTAWIDHQLAGCGALKELDRRHGEVKTMRTVSRHRRRGVGRAILQHIMNEARRRGYERLSLETGSMSAFAPAQQLYLRAGFRYCGPFGEYKLDPNSVFMTLDLR